MTVQTPISNNEHVSKNADTLMEELAFTLEDLQANRDGQLSTRQRQYLEIDRRKNIFLGAVLIVGLVLATTTMLFFGFRDKNWILQGLSVILLACNIGLSWFFALNWIRMTFDLQTNTTETIEGQVQHVVRQFGRAKTGSVRIGDKTEVPTSVKAFTAFEPGENYRLYRTSHSGRLLSVERIK